MTISIALRGDNAIMIFDEDDPRDGVVIDTISAAEELIVALTAAIADLRGQEAEMRAKMRAVAEAVADRDHPIDPR